MERGSKVAIYKLKKIEPKNGDPFYDCVVCERVYNSQKPYSKWEWAFYSAYIFDTSLGLEPADYSLGIDKDKFSYKNIANPDKSIIRVLDFKFELHTRWNGTTQVKEADGVTPSIKRIFYLTRVALGNGVFVSEDKQIERLKQKIEQLKAENHKITAKSGDLRRELKVRSKIIKRKTDEASSAKKELKAITEPKVKKQKHYDELDTISFQDM